MQPVEHQPERSHHKVMIIVQFNILRRPLDSFNENGLSHDLVRMKYMQYEQKRLMKLN